jgi:hypothetical protein
VTYSSKVENLCPESVLDVLSESFRIEIEYPSRERASVFLLEFCFLLFTLRVFALLVGGGVAILRCGTNPLGVRVSKYIAVIWRAWTFGARDCSDLLARRWLGWSLKKPAGQGTSLGKKGGHPGEK